MFRVLKAREVQDYKDWVKIWDEWQRKEIFAHPDYLLLYDEKAEPMCAIYGDGDNYILFPFCLRKIEHSLSNDTYFDLITPYGYGDFYFIGKDCFKQLILEFKTNFDNWVKFNNVICEFIRFNPLSRSISLYYGEVLQNNENIICKLDRGEECIWRGFKSNVRRNIRKAQGLNLKVKQDISGAYVDDFLSLYYGTMDRLNAKKKYYLSKRFFTKVNEKLGGYFSYFYILKGEIPIATALILISDERIYFFLGGSDDNFLNMRPNDLLHYEIIKWGISKKKKEYILGGGHTYNDSLYRFKKGFSPKGSIPYFVGTNIYKKDVYRELCNPKDMDIEEYSFPEYRKGFDGSLI